MAGTVVPITEVLPGIMRIGPVATGHPSAPTSPYLIIGNKRAIVIEPGEDGQVDPVVEAVKICGVDVNDVDYVWASHIHFHHIQGVPWLLKKLPKAKFLVHPRGAPHLIEPTRLIQSTIEVFGDKCYGPFEAIPKERVQAVEDNQVISVGGRELQIIHAPGHAPHHMALFDRQTRALFYGDIAVLGTPGTWRGYHDVRPPLFDIDKFVETIHRYQALNPSIILTFTYGGVSHNPQQTLRWAEEDHLTIARICEQGMRQKLPIRDIYRQVAEYERSVGAAADVEAASNPERGSGGIMGLFAYLKRKYPELEMPVSPRTRGASVQPRQGS
ncbi:MAG: MBL fold metallo-hydrolase [Chloroflexi bacterium]|nr:MBL fold metallo-hydrolase [Chloroflexota bacterium]